MLSQRTFLTFIPRGINRICTIHCSYSTLIANADIPKFNYMKQMMSYCEKNLENFNSPVISQLLTRMVHFARKREEQPNSNMKMILLLMNKLSDDLISLKTREISQIPKLLKALTRLFPDSEYIQAAEKMCLTIGREITSNNVDVKWSGIIPLLTGLSLWPVRCPTLNEHIHQKLLASIDKETNVNSLVHMYSVLHYMKLATANECKTLSDKLICSFPKMSIQNVLIILKGSSNYYDTNDELITMCKTLLLKTGNKTMSQEALTTIAIKLKMFNKLTLADEEYFQKEMRNPHRKLGNRRNYSVLKTLCLLEKPDMTLLSRTFQHCMKSRKLKLKPLKLLLAYCICLFNLENDVQYFDELFEDISKNVIKLHKSDQPVMLAIVESCRTEFHMDSKIVSQFQQTLLNIEMESKTGTDLGFNDVIESLQKNKNLDLEYDVSIGFLKVPIVDCQRKIAMLLVRSNETYWCKLYERLLKSHGYSTYYIFLKNDMENLKKELEGCSSLAECNADFTRHPSEEDSNSIEQLM